MIFDFLTGVMGPKKAIEYLKKIISSEKTVQNKYSIDLRNSNSTVLILDTSTIPDVDSLFGKFALVREEKVPHVNSLVSPYRFQGIVLDELRNVLSINDTNAIRMAFASVNTERDGNIKKAQQIRNDLIRKYKEKGRRIYNMASSEVFQEFIYPFIQMKDQYRGEEDFPRIYEKHLVGLFDEFLDTNPFSIWVNDLISAEVITSGIIERMVIIKSPYVSIYGRGPDSIRKIRRGAKDFISQYDLFESTEKSYQKLGLDAIQCIITRKSGVKNEDLESLMDPVDETDE
jgi:hypothetical protein